MLDGMLCQCDKETPAAREQGLKENVQLESSDKFLLVKPFKKLKKIRQRSFHFSAPTV